MASAPARRIGRFKIPNNRVAAILVALAIGAIGFAIGGAFLILAPMYRAGTGPFAFLQRNQARFVLDNRLRLSSQPALAVPTQIPRVELWQTPIAELAFPSAAVYGGFAPSAGVVEAIYDPIRTRRVLVTQPILDALKRPILSLVVTFGPDDDPALAGPVRPNGEDATHLTLATSVPGRAGLLGCVLALRQGSLRVVSALGGGPGDDCRAGRIPLGETGTLSFALSFQLLPNYHARDGSWREGGVFGRTEVRARLEPTA